MEVNEVNELKAQIKIIHNDINDKYDEMSNKFDEIIQIKSKINDGL